MRPATQKESLPNDIEGLIRRLGQELSCSICLSVFEEPTMTPCNHTFCRECIERAVTLTKKSNTVPLNQCPICKSKAPKRSLNPAAAASKLCSIYEDIVRAYSEMKGGDEDWIHEAGIRGNDAYYTGGGVPLDNLSQLYPHPEKPSKVSGQSLQSINENGDESDLFTDLEDEIANRTNRTNLLTEEDPESTQLETIESHPSKATGADSSKAIEDQPSSPLVYTEETQLTCDRMVINTQELEKLAAINDSIDKELAELEKKLAEAQNKDLEKENYATEESILSLKNSLEQKLTETSNPSAKMKVNPSSCSNKRLKVTISEPVKKAKLAPIEKTRKLAPVEDLFDPKSVLPAGKKAKKNPKTLKDSVEAKVKGITTTGIKNEKDLVALTRFSDKFGFPVLPDFEGSDVSHLLIPTASDLVVKKRTIKYFEALILGKEIVSFDWVSACLKAGRLISSADYKIKGDETGLMQKKKTDCDYQKIFCNYKFYFYGDFSQPPRDQLERLIRATGSSAIIEDVSELSRGSIVLSDPSSQYTFEKDAQIIKKYPIISPNWVLDSISCGRALDFHGYFVL